MKRSSYRGDDKAGTVVKYAGAEGYGGYGSPNKIHYEPIYFNGKKFVHSDKYRTYVNWQTVGGGKVVGTTLEQERAAVAASQERMARADLDPFQQTAKLAEEGKLFQFPDGTYPTGNEKSTSELLHEAVAKLEEEEAEEEEEEEEELDDRFDPDRPLIKPGEAGFDKKYQEYYDANVGRDEAIQNAYGSNRVWTSPDAVITEVTKDGVTTTNVAPRVMFDDRQKMSLFLNGFAWNDLDYCFKKNGALTDQNYADFVDDHIIDGAKNQRDGRNPDNIDQFVYRYVRRTKALEHLPPQFHHGIPLRTNVQHSRDKKERSATDWPVSWITYEEDGYTYCEIPYRTPTDLKEAFDREKFKYDGVAKRWYYPGMLDEAMELRLAALNVRRLGEPVTVEGEQPVTAEETAPEEPVVSDISEEPTVLEESDTPSAVEEYEEAVSQVKNGASSFDEWSERLENSGLSDNDKAKAYQYAATMLGFSNNVQEDEQQVLQYLNHYLNDLIGKSDEDTASEPEPQTEPEPETNETEAKETTFDNGLNDVFEYGGYGATPENYQELMEKTADVDTLQAYANERWGEPFSKKEIDVINQAKAVIDDPNILPELRGRILKNAHQFVFGWDTLDHRLKSDLLRNCLKATDNSLSYDDARQAVDHAHWGWYLTPKATHFSKTRADALKWVYAYRTLPFFSDQQNDEIVAREKNLLNLARDPAVSHVEALYIVDQLGSINDSVRKALDNYKENPGYYDQSGFAEKKWDQTTNDLNELEAKVSLLRDKVASQSAETVETPVEPAIEEPTVKTQTEATNSASAILKALPEMTFGEKVQGVKDWAKSFFGDKYANTELGRFFLADDVPLYSKKYVLNEMKKLGEKGRMWPIETTDTFSYIKDEYERTHIPYLMKNLSQATRGRGEDWRSLIIGNAPHWYHMQLGGKRMLNDLNVNVQFRPSLRINPNKSEPDNSRNEAIEYFSQCDMSFPKGTKKADKESVKGVCSTLMEVAAMPTTTDYEVASMILAIKNSYANAKSDVYYGQGDNFADAFVHHLHQYIPDEAIQEIGIRAAKANESQSTL